MNYNNYTQIVNLKLTWVAVTVMQAAAGNFIDLHLFYKIISCRRVLLELILRVLQTVVALFEIQ